MKTYCLYDKSGKELLSLDVCHLDRDANYSAHIHHKLEISLVKSGRGVYEIGSYRYNIKAGDVFLISNTERHRIVIEDDDKLANLVLHFEPEFLWSLIGNDMEYRLLNVFFSRQPTFRHSLDQTNPTTGKIADLLLQIEREMIEERPYYDLQVKILMETMILYILRGYNYFSGDGERSRISYDDACRTREVLHYIDLNLRNHLTLQELAKVACLSPAYFSALFKRYNGIALFDYITRKRVECAINLITDTDYSMTYIANLCGFNNSTSFNKAFRRITGEAPSYFRKSVSTAPARKIAGF